MPLEFLVKQMLGEVTFTQSTPKPQTLEKKPFIVFKCYAHIMNNGNLGMTKKSKTKDSDMNLKLTFNGDTKNLIKAEFICPLKNEKEMYDSSKFVIGL